MNRREIIQKIGSIKLELNQAKKLLKQTNKIYSSIKDELKGLYIDLKV